MFSDNVSTAVLLSFSCFRWLCFFRDITLSVSFRIYGDFSSISFMNPLKASWIWVFIFESVTKKVSLRTHQFCVSEIWTFWFVFSIDWLDLILSVQIDSLFESNNSKFQTITDFEGVANNCSYGFSIIKLFSVFSFETKNNAIISLFFKPSVQ